MIKIMKKMNLLLDKKQKRRMVLIVFLMLIGGVLESLSISAVIPVVEALVVENAVEENRILSLVYETLGLTSKVHLTVIMMVSLILLFVLKNLFLFFHNWLFRFSTTHYLP